MKTRFLISASLLWAILNVNIAVSAQPLSPQQTVKTPEGANDPMAHAYMEKTRKWINSHKTLELRFEACAEENDNPAPGGCHRGSLLTNGNKYRLIMGADEFYCNGTNLWVYAVAHHEVSIYSAKQTLPDMDPVSLVKNHAKYYRAKYIRQQTMDGMARNIIDLTPLQASEVAKIRLYLNDNDYKFYKLEVYLPQNRRFLYTNFTSKENVPTKSSDFVFDQSRFPDVQVNDMRE